MTFASVLFPGGFRGFVLEDEHGKPIIRLQLQSRVSTSPGAMERDNPHQRRAFQLKDAPAQMLRLPKDRTMHPATRCFNMRLRGSFTPVYGAA